MAARTVRFVQPEELELEHVSPELVLVSSPEFATRARRRLGPRPVDRYTAGPPLVQLVHPGGFTPSRPVPLVASSGAVPTAQPWGSALMVLLTLVGVGLILALPLARPRQEPTGALRTAQPQQSRELRKVGVRRSSRTTTRSRPTARAPRRVRINKRRPTPISTRVRRDTPKKIYRAWPTETRGTVHLAFPAVSARSLKPHPLFWQTRPGASYYDVAVYRSQTKIYEAWPTEPTLTLPERWFYRGRSFQLAPGEYTWYAWAGFGARAETDYRKPVEKHHFRLR